MKTQTKLALGGLVLVLIFLGVLLPDRTQESRAVTPSTYGKALGGYGALFELLQELEFPVERSLASPTRLAAQKTIWWLEPQSLCEKVKATEDGVGHPDAGEAPGAGDGDTVEPAPEENSDGESKEEPDAPESVPSVPEEDASASGELAGFKVTQKSVDEPEVWRGVEWVEQGGTALVFLTSLDSCSCPREAGPGATPNWKTDWIYECGQIAGFALPKRSAPERRRHEAQRRDLRRHENLLLASVQRVDFFSDLFDRKSNAENSENPDESSPPNSLLETLAQYFESDLSPVSRRLETEGLLAFDEALDWQVRGTLDGRPFVLERELGAGRIVVIADVAFLRNRWLDSADSAPLALDLVQSYGAPIFDEYEHGFRAEYNALHYLLRSRALPLFVGLALLGLVYVWRGNAYPKRSVSEIDIGVPTLETFVDSAATLYSRTRDFAQVFACYRELTLDRIRRHCGLAPSASLLDVKERLERDARISRKLLRGLVDPPVVKTAGELYAAVQILDLLWDEVRR